MRALTLNQLISWTPPHQPWIIDLDILIEQGTMMVYGAKETWKSMLFNMHLPYCVARGVDWFGFHTKQSPVLVFQTEVPQVQQRKRLIKYAMNNHITSDMVWYWSELYMKVDKGWGFSELEKEVMACQPKLLVIDPLFSSVTGNLLDDYDMGQFMDRLDSLRAKYKLAIVIVHHSRIPEHTEGVTFHYGSEELFGTSRWERWLDTIIYITKDNDDPNTQLVDLTLTFEKTRHTETKLAPMKVQVDRKTLMFRRTQ